MNFLKNTAPSYIDLHIHSSHSDGLLSPYEIVEIAKQRRLQAISITDHDVISAVQPAIEAGQSFGMEVIPGVEFSSTYLGSEIHILGYFINNGDKSLCEYIAALIVNREERAREILSLLQRVGIHIPFELIKRKVNGGVICRPHIADVLVEEGYCFSHYEAFEKYLGQDKLAFVPKKTHNPENVIHLIQKAGGLAFLAHPVIGTGKNMLTHLREYGFDGIEIIHPKHTQWDVMKLTEIARQNQLLCCGGSDCHGARPGEVIIGSMKIPYHYLDLMKEAANINLNNV